MLDTLTYSYSYAYANTCIYVFLCHCKCVRTFHLFDSFHRLHCGLNLIKSVLTNSNEVQYNNIRSNKAKRISFLCAKIYRIAPTLTPHSRRTSFYTIPFLNSKEKKIYMKQQRKETTNTKFKRIEK